MNENQEWNARLFADKVIKKAVQEEIEKLALVVLGNYKLKITHRKEGFDHVRQSSTGRPYTYSGAWREWFVLGHSKTDVYLEVLRMLANDSSTYYPIVSYRYDKHWVDREEFEKLQAENKQVKDAYEDRVSDIESLEKALNDVKNLVKDATEPTDI
ncbi:hypothetical protein ACFRCQ_17990 [Cytobacillus firmus]|uniref:hypothetical protein n=1 Tax=Cytobacillus firmus TaxID=1399 RepID=UPI0036B3A77A